MNAEQALELSVALTEFKKYIELNRVVGEGTKMRLSVTGEEYVVLAPHILPEGEAGPVFSDFDAMLAAARAGFNAYAKDRPGALYWRVLPDAEYRYGTSEDARSGWIVYMRLLISDKPATHKEA